MVHCGPLWSVVVRCGPLWSVVVRCGPLWSVVVRCGPLWSVVVRYCPVLSVRYCPLLSVIVRYCPLLSVIVHCGQLPCYVGPNIASIPNMFFFKRLQNTNIENKYNPAGITVEWSNPAHLKKNKEKYLVNNHKNV